MAYALKPGKPLAFTYHHNSLAAYTPIAVAILDAGLVCSASIPCPGEMGASIHIAGTGSSIIDTVFVCRSTGSVSRRLISSDSSAIAEMVRQDLVSLSLGGIKPTAGDIRCVSFGHIVRLAVWFLRQSWNRETPVTSRIDSVNTWIEKQLGGVAAVLASLGNEFEAAPSRQPFLVREESSYYGRNED